MYVDIFIAGVGKWYEFKCGEEEKIKDIIKQIYIIVTDIERINNIEQEQNQQVIEQLTGKIDLQLACLESKKILEQNARLKDCPVENGNRLILF